MVGDDELMTIGRFAEISGLSAHTLRHYDEIALFAPAEVDAETNYRRYRRGQVQDARLIQSLRRVDLPIDEIKKYLLDPTSDDARDILLAHRDRLAQRQDELTTRITEVDYFLEKGITMTPTTNARPVQLMIAVDDADAAVAFYTKAFGFHYDVTRRTEDRAYSGFVFSNYGEPDFFLMHLLADPRQAERRGPSTFGLLVDDLDAAHAQAIAAGGTEVSPPLCLDGMPKRSGVTDPSGNWIWLYQNER